MKILVINGPNLNMLGKREPSYYGDQSLKEIERAIRKNGNDLGLEVDFCQSNHEGALVEHIHEAPSDASAIVINAGALSHYGLSLRDALVDSGLPIVEVHLSNIHSREEFRQTSVIASIASGQIIGLGWQGYIYALEYLATLLRE